MLEKYLELLEHNLNWVKRQIREDERMKDLRFAREILRKRERNELEQKKSTPRLGKAENP